MSMYDAHSSGVHGFTQHPVKDTDTFTCLKIYLHTSLRHPSSFLWMPLFLTKPCQTAEKILKYLLCTSHGSTLTKGIASQDFPAHAQCVFLVVILYLQHVYSRGNTCQHLPHSSLQDTCLLSGLTAKDMSDVLQTLALNLQTNAVIYNGIIWQF